MTQPVGEALYGCLVETYDKHFPLEIPQDEGDFRNVYDKAAERAFYFERAFVAGIVAAGSAIADSCDDDIDTLMAHKVENLALNAAQDAWKLLSLALSTIPSDIDDPLAIQQITKVSKKNLLLVANLNDAQNCYILDTLLEPDPLKYFQDDNGLSTPFTSTGLIFDGHVLDWQPALKVFIKQQAGLYPTERCPAAHHFEERHGHIQPVIYRFWDDFVDYCLASSAST